MTSAVSSPASCRTGRTGEVLTLAYMNAQALARTRETGELHLYSRSRDELWHKGATSGNVQAVRALRLDCDGDAVLALVEPAGPACHTGERTLLSPRRARRRPPPHEVLPGLERTLAERARARPAGFLHRRAARRPAAVGCKGAWRRPRRSRARRARSPTERVDEEAADVLYHLLVLLHGRGRALADAERVLDDRRR